MLIQSKDDFYRAVNYFADSNYLAVDTETTSITNREAPSLIGISVSDGQVSAYFPFNHVHDHSVYPSVNLPNELLDDIGKLFVDRTLIFHNAKFDIAVLERAGFEVSPKWWDTMLMAHMVNENEYTYGLKELGRKYISDDADDEKKVIGKLLKILGAWEKIPPLIMGVYAEKDALLTFLLWEYLMPKMETEEQLDLWDTQVKFSETLRRMEARGIPINPDRAKELAWECEVGMQEILAELDFDPAKADELATKLFKPSPVGLGYLPESFGKRKTANWPGGVPHARNETLEKFDHPIVKKVIEYRGYVKAKSTWFDGFPNVLWPDGRVHPTYKIHGTVTSRLSCSDPNMQQLPREHHDGIKGRVKSMLNPAPGWGIWEFDYSQMEYRLAACYGKDQVLVDAYRQGSDMHSATADLVDISRQDAKTLNFAILYGAGAAKIAEMLNVTQKEAYKIIARFWSQYPGIQSAVEAAVQAAYTQGFVPLWNGRRRRLRGEDSAHKAFNSVIQGGGAQIMVKSMNSIDEQLPDVRMIAQVHDSVWVEMREDEAPEVSKEIIKLMEWPSEPFGVPFVVDSKQLA